MDSVSELEPDELFFQQGDDGTYRDGPGLMPSLTPVALEPDFELEPVMSAEQLARAGRFRRPVALFVSGLGVLFLFVFALRRPNANNYSVAADLPPSPTPSVVSRVTASPAPLDTPAPFIAPSTSPAQSAASTSLAPPAASASSVSLAAFIAPSASAMSLAPPASAPLAPPASSGVAIEPVRIAAARRPVPSRPAARPAVSRVSAFKPRPAAPLATASKPTPARGPSMTEQLSALQRPQGLGPIARFPDYKP